jgi:DNA adenine methylase Dam
MVIKETKKVFVKSPLNYVGGKYRLLSQLFDLFPNQIETFYDIFAGGANVASNVEHAKVIAFDINQPLISFFQYLKTRTYDQVVTDMEVIIERYNLSNSMIKGYNYYSCDSAKGLSLHNKEGYVKLRGDYNENKGEFDQDLLFFALVIYGFNNQIRYNGSGKFNNPVGKRDFNSKVRANLKMFMESINDIDFSTTDFRSIDISEIQKDDFVYADPPYLITTATYNERNGWTEKEEQELHDFLDNLHAKGVKFAMSNVMVKDGAVNDMLESWSKKYNVHDMKISYQNSNYQKRKTLIQEREVLITNY